MAPTPSGGTSKHLPTAGLPPTSPARPSTRCSCSWILTSTSWPAYDNIDATQDKLEARISNFAVAAGQELYLRVTGVGNIFGGPQNAARGEVVMDFTFDRPMGTEPGNDIFRFSAPYPNPASTYTAVEVSTRKATDITLHYTTGWGGVLSVPTGFHAAGEKQKILVDVARLPGEKVYIIGVEGSSVPAGKLMVVR